MHDVATGRWGFPDRDGAPKGPHQKKLLPGFEPGSLDSKSRVITITLQKLLCAQKVVIEGLEPSTLGLLDPCSTI